MSKKKRAIKNSKASEKRIIKEKTSVSEGTGLLLIFLLLLITGVSYLPMFGNTFTNWDDDFYVINNKLITGPDWQGIFSQPVVANYHPLTIISYSINYALTGLNPSSYLLFNYLLHLINTLLVFYLFKKISGGKLLVAFLTALIFGIHPMHVESVAWIAERKDVLYTCFFLLGLIKYWDYLSTGNKKLFWYSFIFFILSLLSKPAAIVFPLVLLLLDFWKGAAINKKKLIEKIPFFIFSILFAIITLKIQSTSAVVELDAYPLWSRPLMGSYAVMMYLIKFSMPYPLSAFHPFPDTSQLPWQYLLAPLIVILLVALLIIKKKNKLLVFGSLFFITNLLLVTHIVSIGSSVYSDRYTYIPYLGLAFMFSMFLVGKTGANRNLFWLLSLFIIIVFGFLTFNRIKVWKNSDTLWTNVINQYPAAPLPRTNRANYNISQANDPSNASIVNQLYTSALEDCNAALATKPDDEQGLANRQNIYLNLNQDSLALADANTLIGIAPNNKTGYYTRGVVYSRRNQPENALNDLNKCISLDPSLDYPYSYRAFVQFTFYKRYKEAIEDYNKAIAILPKTEHYLNRSYCYFNMGDLENARNDARSVLNMGGVLSEDYRKALNL